MTVTIEQRVTDLEADAYRAAHRGGQTAAALAHLRDGVDTVSQDLRGVAHEVHGEVLSRLDRIEGRLDRLQAGQQALQRSVTALLAHFDIADPNAT